MPTLPSLPSPSPNASQLPRGSSLDFSGRNVFVAGGTSGINLAIGMGFARAGANVFVISRDEEKVKHALALLSAVGGTSGGQSADVRDYSAVEQAVEHCVASWGPLDVVVSGAAGNFPARAAQLSSNGFRAVLEIDLLGTHHVMRACYPHLRRPGASVINISAPQAEVAMVGQAHVCAAKAGVDSLTQTLALEWGREGIRVNSVMPGPIEGTEGMARLVPHPEGLVALEKQVPLRRLGKGEDIANACLWLSSPLAAYVSGAVVPVDGGWRLNLSGSLLEPLLGSLDDARSLSKSDR